MATKRVNVSGRGCADRATGARSANGPRQGRLPFGHNWGGRRQGAGRKPKGEKPGVPHRRRPPLAARHPVHVTSKLQVGLPSLRRPEAYSVVLAAFRAGCEKPGFRLVQFSVLSNHLHLLVEGRNREALTRGLRGLLVRLARGLNKLWGRQGRVFADRFHDHVVKTPRQVRNALGYLLHNARRHGCRVPAGRPDPYSSGRWFDGWAGSDGVHGRLRTTSRRVVAAARTWLLAVGWRRHGLVPP